MVSTRQKIKVVIISTGLTVFLLAFLFAQVTVAQGIFLQGFISCNQQMKCLNLGYQDNGDIIEYHAFFADNAVCGITTPTLLLMLSLIQWNVEVAIQDVLLQSYCGVSIAANFTVIAPGFYLLLVEKLQMNVPMLYNVFCTFLRKPYEKLKISLLTFGASVACSGFLSFISDANVHFNGMKKHRPKPEYVV